MSAVCVRICTTDESIEKCRPLLAQLVGERSKDGFLEHVNLQQNQGYVLVALLLGETYVTAAGFKIVETLSWGRILFLDDLVTDQTFRNQGYGTQMFHWLKNIALEHGCREIQLDSGLQRADAHRFYERLGMKTICYHFSLPVTEAQDGAIDCSTVESA